MIDDFAVFILSHGRAGNVITASSLLRAGFDSFFVVVDDMDDQLAAYQELFGDDCLVFDKEAEYRQTDTMDNFRHMASPVYARHWVQRYASENNIRFYAVLDDDISDFAIRYADQGKMKRKRITDIAAVFAEMIAFLDSSADLKVISFANEGGMIGGLKGNFSKGVTEKIQQVIICDINKPIRWTGTFNEDLNAVLFPDSTGFAVMNVANKSPARGTNGGGIQYVDSYRNNFYSFMLHPSSISLANGSVHRNNFRAKILNEKWKK